MMGKYWAATFGVVLVCSWLISSYGEAADMDGKLIADLINTLNQFAQRHALSDTQVESLLGQVVLNGQRLRKGGVGIIDKETFVVLKEHRNVLILSGQRWEGKESSEPEVVLTDGRSVLSSIQGMNVSDLKILIFTPTEVRYINLSNNSGGKYLR